MNCDECKAQTRFNSESAMAMAERTIRRLWITVLVLIAVMAGMCIAFFAYEAQFEDYEEVVEIEAEQEGDWNFVSGGDLTYAAESEGSENN